MAIDLRSLKRVNLTDSPAQPDRRVPPSDAAANDVAEAGDVAVAVAPANVGIHLTDDHDAGSCALCEQIQSELAANPVQLTPLGVPAAEARVEQAAIEAPAEAPADAPVQAPVEAAVIDSGLDVLETDAAGRPDEAPSDPAETRAEPGGRRRRSIVVIATLASVAAAVALVLVILNATSSKSPTSAKSTAAQSTARAAIAAESSAAAATTPPATSSVAAALDWARQTLPLSAPLLTDAQTQRDLVAAGFTSVAVGDTQATPTFAYLIDTPAWRAGPPSNSAAVTGSVPVAVFGSAAGEVTVRQAVADSPTVVSARQAADASTRRTAEQQLLLNKAIQVTGNALATLQAGQLDLRAATVVAYLANSTTVTLANVTASAPEQAAGLPVRSIDISIGAPTVMQTIVSGLPVAYQPTSVTQLSTGALRMVWPISAEPLPGLS